MNETHSQYLQRIKDEEQKLIKRLYDEAISKGLKTEKDLLYYIMQTSGGSLNPKIVKEKIENEYSNRKVSKN